MAKTYHHTFFMHMGNILATTLVRAGVKIGPIHLLTVRGRKSGEPRTTPIAVVEQDGQRYLIAPFGAVNWVRNLQAAGEATLTHGRRSEAITVVELAPEAAGPVLKRSLENGGGGGFKGYFNVSAESSLADFVREALEHPVFQIVSSQRVSLAQS
jgi:deazaflavin-dependent oxidoreductase (nitroreductase family)